MWRVGTSFSPLNGGTPGCVLSTFNSGSWRSASFSDSRRRRSQDLHPEPKFGLLNSAETLTAGPSFSDPHPHPPAPTSDFQTLLPRARRQMLIFSKLRQDFWGGVATLNPGA